MRANRIATGLGLAALMTAIVAAGAWAEEDTWKDTGYTAELAWADWMDEQYLSLDVDSTLSSWARPGGQAPELHLDLLARGALTLGTRGTRVRLFAELEAPRRLDDPTASPPDTLTLGGNLGAWLFGFPDIRPYIGAVGLASITPATPRWSSHNDYVMGGGFNAGIAARTEDITVRLDGTSFWLLPGLMHLDQGIPELAPEDVIIILSDVSGRLYVERWFGAISFVRASAEDPTDAEVWSTFSWDASVTYAVGWGFAAGTGVAHQGETTYWKAIFTYAREADVLVQAAYLHPLRLGQEGLQPRDHWLLELSIETRLHL